MKTETIKFNDFMNGSWKGSRSRPEIKVVSSSLAGAALLLPKVALAAGIDSTFGNVHGAVMNAVDSGVVLIIIFSGAAWMFGHRTKGIEILLGVAVGYIIARHAIDIRDFLKTI